MTFGHFLHVCDYNITCTYRMGHATLSKIGTLLTWLQSKLKNGWNMRAFNYAASFLRER